MLRNSFQLVNIGSDPELFIKMDGEITGSEKLIPKTGLICRNTGHYGIVRDGVQLELHPSATYEKGYQIYYVRSCLVDLNNHLTKYPNIKVCWDEVVEISKDRLMELSEETRVLGCQPSDNYYGLKPLTVDPIKYRKRSAGGHVHFGLPADLKDDAVRLIPILDVMLGNTCVLLDRDPMQTERRKLYGRAGEYRKPAHGIEYRTLSNFWLKYPAMANFVFMMAMEAATVLQESLNTRTDLEGELLRNIDFKKLVKGIQLNDRDLALETWEVFKGFILKYGDAYSPIPPAYVPNFERFIKRVHKEGLDKVFPGDPFTNWLPSEGYGQADGAVWNRALTKF